MPLDRTNGETLSGLQGDPYKLVPLSKWSDTALWDIACKRATVAFLKAGAMNAPTFDESAVLVQEYPIGEMPRIAFIFCKRCEISPWKRGDDQSQASKELCFPVVVGMSPAMKAEMVMAGRWTDVGLH